MAMPFTALNKALKPFRNLVAGRPVLATFQVNLRCNSACGYCDLPLNVGRYEMSRVKSGGFSPASTMTVFVLCCCREGSRCYAAIYRRSSKTSQE